MITALALLSGAYAQDVAIYGAATDPGHALDVQSMLFCTQEFSTVDIVDAAVETPTLADLQQYFAVMIFSETGVPFADRAGSDDQHVWSAVSRHVSWTRPAPRRCSVRGWPPSGRPVLR